MMQSYVGDEECHKPDETQHLLFDGSDPSQSGDDIFALKRSLTFWHGFSFIMGMMLGSGMFISPGLVAAASPNMFVALVIWILCGLLVIASASCFCELTCIYKKTGGVYTFLACTYGRVIGFANIWTDIWIVSPIVTAVIAHSAGTYIAQPFFSESEHSAMLWTAKSTGWVIFIVLSVLNCIGVKEFGRAQNIFAFSQIAIAVLIIGMGIWQVTTTRDISNFRKESIMKDMDTVWTWKGMHKVGLAAYAVLWAYEGWSCVPYMVEELKNPSRNIPLTTFTSMPLVVVIYVLLNLALMAALTKEEIGQAETVGLTMATKVAPHSIRYIMPILVAICCFGTLNSSIYITGRAYLAAAREGNLPAFFSWIHKTKRTPIPAILANAIITTLWMLISDSAQTFINYFNFVLWIWYGLSFMAIPRLRKRWPKVERTYRVYYITPFIMAAASSLMALLGFAAAPIGSSISLIFVCWAFPIYYVCLYKRWTSDIAADFVSRLSTRIKTWCNFVPCDIGHDE